MLKWLYGRSTGKVESTICELYGTFQRNGFVPIGLKSILLDMEKNKSIKIHRQTNSKGFLFGKLLMCSWLSYIHSFFGGEDVGW